MNPTNRLSLSRKTQPHSWRLVLLGVVGIFIFACLLLGILRLTYQGRFLPGARVYGVYVGGLTKDEAQKLLQKQTSQYIESSIIEISGDGLTNKASIPASEIELQYNIDKDLENAYLQGRKGQLIRRLYEQTTLMVGLNSPPQATVSYNGMKLYSIVVPISKAMSTPANNARYTVDANSSLAITPEQIGSRMNLTSFLDDYQARVSSMQREAIAIQRNNYSPTITKSVLEGKKNNLELFAQQPLILTYEQRKWTVPTPELLGWLSYSDGSLPLREDLIQNHYRLQPNSAMHIGLNSLSIKNFLIPISKDINQKAQDATLTIEGDRATVFQQSQDGRALDMNSTIDAISKNLLTATPTSTIALAVNTTKADVTSESIDRLGIKELLSEGASYFPGSSANRLTNIRIGAKRYNGVLLKPGQVFSFGEILGKVGPEQGYKEGRVILEGRTESQYGGGLCQVSSTAFRAALLAGLPILERYNHSFAVDYYTQPYGVPGVDATIYYPSVDFKFKNDTANHILIQTEMIGTTLKFRFYGTKEKSGVIRGPFFISGSNDATQPSKTVFYRDIVVGDKVTKTTTFYTTYRSSLDFPPVD